MLLQSDSATSYITFGETNYSEHYRGFTNLSGDTLNGTFKHKRIYTALHAG
ncbi:MAG: hypothetical protein ACI8P9_001363 [Parasphingorhabdus sp.]|jgi:hypothetical protein